MFTLYLNFQPDALFDDKDSLDMVQLSYKAKKRGIELMKRIRFVTYRSLIIFKIHLIHIYVYIKRH